MRCFTNIWRPGGNRARDASAKDLTAASDRLEHPAGELWAVTSKRRVDRMPPADTLGNSLCLSRPCLSIEKCPISPRDPFGFRGGGLR